ncbi:hypothetical protein DVH05_021505 [Phytophthora capsici]|nr:hypothetical protein DVH05_021504 [Phytophthora capsici]KAG1694425.1 hypothetical protein DVH05_021505 [Phytophthora capsici]
MHTEVSDGNRNDGEEGSRGTELTSGANGGHARSSAALSAEAASAHSEEALQSDPTAVASTDVAPPASKRKRGRPKGSKNKPRQTSGGSCSGDNCSISRACEVAPQVATPGGESLIEPAVKSSEAVPASVPKRKRGRPKGSKNKAKANDAEPLQKRARPAVSKTPPKRCLTQALVDAQDHIFPII